MAAAQTSGTVFLKRWFAGAAANGWDGWLSAGQLAGCVRWNQTLGLCLPDDSVRSESDIADWLILLCHKFSTSFHRWQHGQRGTILTRARAMRIRTVVMEVPTWRSGRSGGAPGSMTAG